MPTLATSRRNSEKVSAQKESPIDKFREDFPARRKPSDKPPRMPEAISHLTSEKISDLMIHYTAWREYTEELLVEALSDMTNKKNEYDFEWEKKLLTISGGTVRLREAKVYTDEDIQKLFLPLQSAELYHALLLKKLESYNNCLTIISREISRRSGISYK